jgi:hypothetical protein
MRVAIYDRVEPPVPSQLPFRVVGTCARRTAAVKLCLALPLAFGAGAALVTVALDAALAPGSWAIISQHPAIALEILAAVAFCTYLLALPIKRLLDQLGTERVAEIDHSRVEVTERGHFRTWKWSAPLDSFLGITHHVRASLSGSRHELILVHPDRKKSVLLSVGGMLSQNEMARVAAILGLDEIPARELYHFTPRSWRFMSPTCRDTAHAST